MERRILVTGAAGFIGSHTAEALLRRGDQVLGLDNLDGYYDPARKRANLLEVSVTGGDGFQVVEGDVRDRALLDRLFSERRFDALVHLAALPGVRASIGQATRYFDVNVNGTIALLDACRDHGVPQVVFASTSSVYGNTDRLPFQEDDPCDRPLAPYPASKRAAELLGHSYHHLHGLSFTALRFFTVYGPRNRPDMLAHMLFESVTKGTVVSLYRGDIMRDWTYVDDIVAGILAAIDRPLGYAVLNLGRGEPVRLADFVRAVETLSGRKVTSREEALPPADVPVTHADASRARAALGYDPRMSVHDGMRAAWAWYRRQAGSG